jgi:hypothetical protein
MLDGTRINISITFTFFDLPFTPHSYPNMPELSERLETRCCCSVKPNPSLAYVDIRMFSATNGRRSSYEAGTFSALFTKDTFVVDRIKMPILEVTAFPHIE